MIADDVADMELDWLLSASGLEKYSFLRSRCNMLQLVSHLLLLCYGDDCELAQLQALLL